MPAIKRTEPAKLTWHAVHTKASSEGLAEFHLRRQGYRVFAPWFPIEVIRNRRLGVERRPFFNRYVFIGLDRTQAHEPVNSTIGVSKLITVGERPLVVPWLVMVEIMYLAEFDGLMWPEETAGDCFEPGEDRMVESGPFMGRLAKIAEAVDRTGHVTVLIGQLRASMPATHIGDLVSARVR